MALRDYVAPIPALRAVRPDVPEWLDVLFQQMLAKALTRTQFMGKIGERLDLRTTSPSWLQHLMAALGWR